MNNRASLRHSLLLNAQFTIGRCLPIDCIIQDFCSGGVFLTYGKSADTEHLENANFQRGDQVELLVTISGHFFHMKAKLAHLMDGALGLEFSEPDPLALATLQNLADNEQKLSNYKNADSISQRLLDGEGEKLDQGDPLRVLDVPKLKRVLKMLCIAAENHITPLVELVFTEIEINLIKEANKAHQRQDKRLYMNAIPTLSREQETIQVAFQESLEQYHQNIILLSQSNQLDSQLIKPPQLSIVEKEEFEDWLMIKVMVTKAENMYREPLLELQLRLDELTKSKIAQSNNPYGPAVLCESFRQAVAPLRFNSKVSKQVYLSFKKKVLEQLTSLYEALNVMMIDAGVLTDLNLNQYIRASAITVDRNRRLSRRTTKETKASSDKILGSTTNRSDLDSTDKSTPGNDAALTSSMGNSAIFIDDAAERSLRLQERVIQQAAVSRKVYGAAHQLLQLKKYRESAIERHAEGEEIPSYSRYVKSPKTLNPIYSAKEIIAALTVLQRRNGNKLLAQDKQRLKEKLQGIRGLMLVEELEVILTEKGDSNKEIGIEESEVIEVMERLFDTIVSNAILSEEIKPLIHRLLVPSVKILIMDPTLLTSHNHPVRQVLNNVARLGLKDAFSFSQSIQSAEWAVNEITAHFDTNVTVFLRVLKKLETVLNKHEQVYERNVSRVTETCQGHEQIENAKSKVEEDIDRRLNGKKVPQILIRLLDVGWRELLLLSYLRQGDKSKPWLMGLQVVDQLFLQLTLKAADSPAKFVSPPAILPEELLKLIKNGLLKVPNSASLHDEVLSSIEEYLLTDKKKPKLVMVQTSVSATPRSIVDKLKRKIKNQNARDHSEIDLKKWSERALRIEKGEWVAFDFDGKGMQRARLAWISKTREKFVFVNHQGLKVVEQTLEELASNMCKEAVWSIAYRDLPIVDQGLDTMVHTIYDQLAYEATHDQLTGLMCRKEFERWLGRSIVRAKRDESLHTLIYMDLDQFKVINNICGYEAGDKLLKQIGELLNQHFSAETRDGCVARLGGNTFAILIEKCDEECGYRVADNIITAVQAFRFEWNSTPFTLGVSIGLMEISAECDLVSNLFKNSESACVAAKEAGRDRIHVYRPDDEELVHRQHVMNWVAKVHRALDENRLRLRAQRIEPIIPLGAESSPLRLHYEVLLCVEDENGVQIPPVEFIRAAEKYNRMQAVDRWVINTVFRWMEKNPLKLEEFGGFSINLSGDSLNDERLMKFIFEEFRNFEVPRNKICFEVTETVAITNISDAADFIDEMKSIGCEFSLDDFGTGMSSYTYLKNLSVDYIKIDGAFVRGIVTDANDFAMVKSITEMGHLMGKKVVAEFVENNEILDKLREIGVDYAQGYGIEKPRWIFDE